MTLPPADLYARVEAASRVLTEHVGTVPPIAIVLGSGLGNVSARLASAVVVPYGDLPHWPEPTVDGHAGRVLVGELGSRRVVVLSGRSHVYEGHALSDVTFGVRVLAHAGVDRLVLTNAAGGINADFAPGTLMVIDDHINLMGHNPLIGPNDARFGPRFPDMSQVYSLRMRALAREAAQATGVALAHGVYLAVSGPSYETPAEICAFRELGADAVGMSTVPEAIVARHMGVEVLGLSCIANLAAGMTDGLLSEQDVAKTAARAAEPFGRLLEAIVARI